MDDMIKCILIRQLERQLEINREVLQHYSMYGGWPMCKSFWSWLWDFGLWDFELGLEKKFSFTLESSSSSLSTFVSHKSSNWESNCLTQIIFVIKSWVHLTWSGHLDIEIGIEWVLDNHQNIVCLISSAGRCVIIDNCSWQLERGGESDLSQSGETRPWPWTRGRSPSWIRWGSCLIRMTHWLTLVWNCKIPVYKHKLTTVLYCTTNSRIWDYGALWENTRSRLQKRPVA